MKLRQIAIVLVVGVVVGELRPGLFADILRNATLYVFLPALIFEAAWQLDFTLMRRAWRPIALLAIPGVAITAAVIALVAHAFGGMALAAALVLGAILSATDPVAVVAIFRRLKVPALLATIVESESLLNDAVAVVLYRAILGAIVVGGASSQIGRVAIEAAVGSLVGILTGIAGAWLFSFALRKGVPAVAQALATFAAAYLVYFAAEHLRASGIFAVIALAIGMRQFESAFGSLEVVRSVDAAWTAAATLANAVLFFLVGASVEAAHLWGARTILLWVILGVVVARIAVAYGLLAFAPKMLRSWRIVVQLAGVRGALSLALALGVPASFAARETIIDATFTVVILTILIGALTYERHINALDLAR
ncbi:MAG: cation:proton antiporter [Candidatus Baltobacteraceae bacterium]